MEFFDAKGMRQRIDDDPATLRRRAEAGKIERIRPGTFAAAGQRTAEERHRLLLAGTWRHLAEGTVISHTSAALLHGLPVLRERLGPVTAIRTTSNGSRSRYLHCRRASLAPGEVIELDGIRATSLARTVCDLATTLPFDEALAAADAALARGVQRGQLVAAGRARGRIARVRAHADPSSESPAESMSRALILDAGLPPPALQHEVADRAGRVVARADFAWPELRVIGEFDGAVKYDGSLGTAPADAIAEERQREWRLRDLGWTVVRWSWRDLRSPGVVEQRLRRALQLQGSILPRTAGGTAVRLGKQASATESAIADARVAS